MRGTETRERSALTLQGGACGSPQGLRLVPLLLLPLAVLTSPLTARAAVPCAEPLVQVAYEADTLPEDDPVAPWTANVTGDVLAFVEGGVLVVVAQAGGQVIYDRGEDGLAGASAYAFSARFWLEATQPEASRAGIVLGGKDGTKSPRIMLFDWPDHGRRFLRLETLSLPSPEVELDWSEPHAYRLEVERDGQARVYVDGGLIIEHPYADLTDCAPGEESFGLSQFGLADSTVRWDWVRYEVCSATQGPEVPPPLEVQLAAMQAEVDALAAPYHVQRWLWARLDRVAAEEEPAAQAAELLAIGRHLFVFRRAGVVGVGAERLETLLDFGRASLEPEAQRHGSYLGKIEIEDHATKSGGFIPGIQEAHLRLFVSLSPAAIHALSHPQRRYALLARTAVVEVASGEIASLDTTAKMLPPTVSLGSVSRVEEIDVLWGGVPGLGREYHLAGVVELVELDAGGQRVTALLDQAAAWQRIERLPQQPTGELLASERRVDVKATRVEPWMLELWPDTDASYFITTTQEPSRTADPVLEVLDRRSGALLASADDCPEGMPGYVEREVGGKTYRWYGEVRCEELGGAPIACPSPCRLNACALVRVQTGMQIGWLELVFHAFANGKGSMVDASVWEQTYRLSVDPPGASIVYRRRFAREGLSAGGTFIRFTSSKATGDELEVFAPSPERSDAIEPTMRRDCYPSGSGAIGYLMESHTEISTAALPGPGLLGGSRTGPIPFESGRLFLVGSSDPAGSAARRHGLAVVLNDAANAPARDADGLGELLEAALGTDPDDPDTDGDGLWDGFEVLGLRGAGLYPDQALPTWGADPLHKDVFVENDRYCTDIDNPLTCKASFTAEAIASANSIAVSCPGGPGYLENPDTKAGFTLHVDNGLSDPSTSAFGVWGGSGRLQGTGGVPVGPWSEDEHFSPVRRGIFRYGLSSDAGFASVAQPVFEVQPEVGRSLIHELGHTLGAQHWGKSEEGSDYNNKPHYLSLMNYAYGDGSPSSAYPVGDPRRHHDPANIRFSLGQFRNALTPDGSLAPFALDPAALREDQAFPAWSGLRSTTLVDLEGAPAYFRGDEITVAGVPAVRVDWDRSGTIDLALPAGAAARSDVLYEFNPFTSRLGTSGWLTHLRYVAFDDDQVRFGPQLAARGERLYLFSVPAGSETIRYRVWVEPPGCDPEDSALEDYCGVEVESGGIPGTGITSELSAVSVPDDSGAGDDRLFLFYKGAGPHLCVVHLGPSGWDGPECRDHGTYSSPEAVLYQGKLLVFVPGPPDAQGMKGIRAVLLDPGRWQDALEPWVEADVQVDAGQGQTPMRSRQTPGFSVDPGDGSLVGVLVAEDGAMDAVVGNPDSFATSITLSLLVRNQTWLDAPRVGTYAVRYADYRPAVLAERTASGQPRWTVWAYAESHGMLAGRVYQRLTTSREGESCLVDPTQCRTAFTRHHTVVGPPRREGVSGMAWLYSIDKRNASLASWNGKLRAAVAYDDWHPHVGEPYHAPGFVLFPLGDGVTHLALRDVNDCDTFRQLMAPSLTMLGREPFFAGMPEGHRAAIEDANRVRLPREVRRVESFFLCPTCPPMPFEVGCEGGAP